MTPEQVKTLTRKIKGQDIEPFVLVALYTGMRKGEVLGLQWHDVDITGGELTVRNALKWPGNNAGVISPILKSEAAYRKIPFGGELRAVFLQLWVQRDGPCVFHRNGKPLGYSMFRTMWKKAAAALPDVEKFTPHILRHTCITNWIFAGYDVKTVQYLAGHTDAKTTLNHYAKYLETAQYCGNNLNQIAKKAHALGVIDAEKYDEDVKKIECAIKELHEVYINPVK